MDNDDCLHMQSAVERESQAPLISVIVPVFDDERGLGVCLQALLEQTCRESYEVIVVDNGSPRSPRAFLPNSTSFRLVHESRPGSYAARNRGLSVARGEIVAFTDADCVPAPDWLEKGLAGLLRNPQTGVVAGRIVVCPADPRAPTLAERYQEIAGFPQGRYVTERHFGATANVFTRMSVIATVGGFSDALKSGGDMEWGQRVHAHGFRITYAEDVVVRHPARRRLRELLKQAFRVAGGRREIRNGSNEEALKIAAKPLSSPFGTLKRVWNDPRLPNLKSRLGVVSIGFVLRCAYLFEDLRLAFGGRARR